MEDRSYIRKFIIICIGILIVTIIFLMVTYSIFNNWSKSGTFGDTFGALNAIFSGFAFAGIIISIIQQQDDIKNVRKENEIQRIIDIMSKQAESASNAIEKFSVIARGNTHHGYDAFNQLSQSTTEYYLAVAGEPTNEGDVKMARKKINQDAFSFYKVNKDNITNVSIRLYNSTNVFKSVLLNSNLNATEVNFYKRLYFDHIGFTNINELEKIERNFLEGVELFKEDDSHPVELSTISKAHIFLQSILKFHDATFTKDNFAQLRFEFLK